MHYFMRSLISLSGLEIALLNAGEPVYCNLCGQRVNHVGHYQEGECSGTRKGPGLRYLLSEVDEITQVNHHVAPSSMSGDNDKPRRKGRHGPMKTKTKGE